MTLQLQGPYEIRNSFEIKSSKESDSYEGKSAVVESERGGLRRKRR